MINNYEIIKKHLDFPSEDIFYYAQILKRKKEHPELGSKSYVVKSYFIKSINDLDFYINEMICLANFHNARVYIGLNKRSFRKVAFNTLKKVTDQILNEDYKSIRKAYSSTCGLFTEGDKTWILDIDYPSSYTEKAIKIVLNKIQPEGKNKYICTIPTKNGFHIITKPFNTIQFNELITGIDIHKNNPTVLFIP
jgi:hypothetical protein